MCLFAAAIVWKVPDDFERWFEEPLKHLIVLTIVKLRYINFYTSTDGLVGYDDRFTRDRSRVQLPVGVFCIKACKAAIALRLMFAQNHFCKYNQMQQWLRVVEWWCVELVLLSYHVHFQPMHPRLAFVATVLLHDATILTYLGLLPCLTFLPVFALLQIFRCRFTWWSSLSLITGGPPWRLEMMLMIDPYLVGFRVATAAPEHPRGYS